MNGHRLHPTPAAPPTRCANSGNQRLTGGSLPSGASATTITFRHNAKVHRKALPVPQLFSGMPSLVPGGRNSKQHPKQSVSCTLSYEWTLSETVTYQNSHSVVLTSLPEDELSHSGGPLQPLMGLLAQRVPPTCVLARRENSWCRAGRDPH